MQGGWGSPGGWTLAGGRGQGVAPGGKPHARASLPTAPMLDESVIIQLVEMGFPMDACRKAVYYTGNSGAEAAMNWVMSHMDDPGRLGWGAGWGGAAARPTHFNPFTSTDFANPLILPGSSGPGSTSAAADPPPEDCVTTIVSMGFSRDQALKALRATVQPAPSRAQSCGKERVGASFYPS